MAYVTTCAELDDLGSGQYRHTAYVKPVAYLDGGSLHAQALDWADSGIGARPNMVSASKLMVSVADDGLRRIHPTRELDRYLEIGAPFVKIGGTWTQVSLGTPSRSANMLTWTRPQTLTRILHGGHYLKLDIELLGGFVPEDNLIAFPVGIQGLTRSGLNILRDGLPAGRLRQFIMEDADNERDRRPIVHDFVLLAGQPYLLLTLPDLTGMSRPRIDPTYESQPDGTAGKDCRLDQALPTTDDSTSTSWDAIVAGDGNPRRALVQFDISSIPASASVSSATFYGTGRGSGSNEEVSLHRITRTWTEVANWNTYNGTNNWTSSGGDYDATADATFTPVTTGVGVVYDWNVATLIAELLVGTNNGWLVKKTTETGANTGLAMYSSDFTTAGYRPKLVVEYTAGNPLLMHMQQHAYRRGTL